MYAGDVIKYVCMYVCMYNVHTQKGCVIHEIGDELKADTEENLFPILYSAAMVSHD